ncbi:MAG: hypothetical protein PWP08_829 [Methanofollis sp.]|nr:hypothetical protein [Methanofollis sp.]
MNTKPRKVRQEDIDAFEERSPFYRGIGKRMVEHGIWEIVEEEEKACET